VGRFKIKFFCFFKVEEFLISPHPTPSLWRGLKSKALYSFEITEYWQKLVRNQVGFYLCGRTNHVF